MARKKVTSVPALADWGAVDNALRDIRECQHTLAEMAVQRDRQIDSIKADYAQGALPLQNRVKALESEVKAYVDLHRAELDGKSRALNFGTVGYRVSSKLMLASSRVAEAIATLKVLGHTELIKTTETLDREALKRQPGDILQQVGAYIRTVDEFGPVLRVRKNKRIVSHPQPHRVGKYHAPHLRPDPHPHLPRDRLQEYHSEPEIPPEGSCSRADEAQDDSDTDNTDEGDHL